MQKLFLDNKNLRNYLHAYSFNESLIRNKNLRRAKFFGFYTNCQLI